MRFLFPVLLSVALSLPSSGAQEKPTEIVFVGTQHFISDMPPGYTPAHLRVLLAKINPAALAVEAPSGAKNPWDFAPLELQWVTKPWADQHHIPLVPVGWTDAFYQLKLQNMLGAIQKAGKGDDYQKLEARVQAEMAAVTTCEQFNDGKFSDLLRQYHRTLHDFYGKDTPWETWNARILENLRGALKEYRGKRVAIVFGAAHGYYLVDALAKEEGVKVVPCSSFFPLDAKDVAGQTTAKDHLLALRTLNFGVASPDQLRELEKHLDSVKDVKEYQGDYELFSGKLLLNTSDFAGASARFGKVAALGDDRVSSFDGTTRLNEAGALYGALALARQGKTAEARDQVDAVLRKEFLSATMRQWAQQLQKELAPPK